jgi:hypothetical protein
VPCPKLFTVLPLQVQTFQSFPSPHMQIIHTLIFHIYKRIQTSTRTQTHTCIQIYIYNTHTHIYITCNQNKKLFSTHRKLTSSYFSHVFPMTWRCLCAVRRAPCARWRSWCRAPGNGTAVRWPFWAEGARAMSPRMPGCRGTWGTMEGCFFFPHGDRMI